LKNLTAFLIATTFFPTQTAIFLLFQILFICVAKVKWTCI